MSRDKPSSLFWSGWVKKSFITLTQWGRSRKEVWKQKKSECQVTDKKNLWCQLGNVSFLTLRKEWNSHRYFVRGKTFYAVILEETFCRKLSELSYLSIWSNDDEYKLMAKMRAIQNWIKISSIQTHLVWQEVHC
jgi:hypothetical protein